MTASRIVSLAPSATATLVAMGVADRLVGVTVHCDPGEADPTVVGGWLSPDLDRVAALGPDLVLTSDALQAEIRDEIVERGLPVHHRSPATLEETIDGFAELGDVVGEPGAGAELADRARRRLASVREAVGDRDPVPVYCEEWGDPPMAAGNWVPESVAVAGGDHPFTAPGERSREVDRAAVEGHDPDHVVLHHCGHGERVDPDEFHHRDWDVDAAVHVVDDALLNQPSPTLVAGIERLASLFHDVDVGDDPGPEPAADGTTA